MQPPYGTLDAVPTLRDALVPGFVFVIAISLIVRDVLKKLRSRR